MGLSSQTTVPSEKREQLTDSGVIWRVSIGWAQEWMPGGGGP